MAIITLSGRTAISQSISLRDIRVAWGTGNGSWVTPPAESDAATGLQNELGRVIAEKFFVTPAVGGAIETPAGNFDVSAEPTRYLLVNGLFDFADDPAAAIRELGVFIGTVPVPGASASDRYLSAAQVDDPGLLLRLENIAPVYRSPTIREKFNIVIKF